MAKVEIDIDLITKEMDSLKDDKARLQFELKNVEKEIEKRELQLRALLRQAKTSEMSYGIYEWYVDLGSRKMFNQRLFKAENPEMYEKYYIEKDVDKFVFKINN